MVIDNFILFVIGATTASMVLVGQSLPIQDKSNATSSTKVSEQQDHSCQLDRNETAKIEFEQSVREKHGISEPHYDGVFVAITATSIDQDIRCRSLRTCRNGNVTWCVDVYHPMENVEACFSEGLLVNATEAALGLDLPSYFEVSARGGLRAKKLPLLFSNSYLTCSVHDESQNCTKKTFTSLGVSFQSSEEEPPRISISHHGPESNNVSELLIIGETNVFYCEAEYNLSTSPPLNFHVWWQIDGVDMDNAINEDPYCDPASNTDCIEDRLSNKLKTERIRFYNLMKTKHDCPIPTYVISNWMLIDEATEQDASHDYSCRASYVSFPSFHTIGKSSKLHLEPSF